MARVSVEGTSAGRTKRYTPPAGSIFGAAPFTGKPSPNPIAKPKPSPTQAFTTNLSRTNTANANAWKKTTPVVKKPTPIVKKPTPVVKKPYVASPRTGPKPIQDPPKSTKPAAPKASAPKIIPPKGTGTKPTGTKPAATVPKPTTTTTKTPTTNPKPTPTTNPPVSAVDPTSAASNARLDALTKEAEAYKARIDAALKAGFTYNPENDAAYKSMQVLAQKNAEVASKGAMETMNDRGILNSTVTSDRLGQIQQTAQDQVTAAIPGLEHDAYGRYMDKVNSLHSLWGETMTQAQTERSFGEQHNQWATSRADQNYQWNKSFEETQKVDGWNHDNQIANQEIANQNYGLSSINNTISENNYLSKQSTQNAIADIVQFKNADAAMGYLRKNAAALRNNGVDLSVLIAQIVKMWPKSKKAAEALSFSGK